MTQVDEGPLRYIDSDGHILEPPTGMLEYAPAEYRDRIWHCETDSDGVEWIVWDGQRNQAGGLAGTAGFTDEMVERVRNLELTYSQTRPSGWTASLRLADLDQDGIELSVLYPTMMLGLQSLRDVKFGRAQARAYNDWCADHLREGQGRLFGAGALPPIHDRSRHPGSGRRDPSRGRAAGDGLGLHAARTRRSSGATSTILCMTLSGLRCRTLSSRWRFTRSWLRTCRVPAKDLKLARLRDPDGSYQSLDEFANWRTRPAAPGSPTSTSPRPSPTPST